jgi:hypothetical protein
MITVKSHRVVEQIMFSEYIRAALRRAKYESLENGPYMATVEGLWGGHFVISKIVRECISKQGIKIDLI